MPSQPKASNVNSRSKAFSAADDADTPFFPPDPEPGVKTGRKKNKNGTSKQTDATEISSLSDVARDPSPLRSQSILGQIPRSFPNPRRPSNDDLLEELNATEKVEDQHTPPQEPFIPEPTFGRSPRTELIPGLSYATSPQTQPSYVGKGGFNARSPPISPPQAKARPVSYGGPPSTYGYPRTSTSPYQHSILPYGSPPALPHLPQQHFYNAQDINLGIPSRPESNKSRPRTFTKFARFPGSTLQSPEALLVGYEAHLDILEYNGENTRHVGSLTHLSGVVQDAVFLTTNSDCDLFANSRPLIALILHNSASIEPESHDRPSSRLSSHEAGGVPSNTTEGGVPITTVVVYSLQTQEPVVELLRVKANAPQYYEHGNSGLSKHSLTLQASGNHLVVSSGVSGESFIFGTSSEEATPKFQCLTKLWTTLQPQIQRRDSSHSRTPEIDASPADHAQGQELATRPILAINGRWLSYCPVLTSSNTSVGAVVGSSVTKINTSAISSRSPPSRPTVNCEVDSPDADTLLSKVARGAAQGLLRGGKWLGEKSWQAWKNWNQDSSLTQQPQNLQRSPIYSPQLAPAQFPPTHGESFQTSVQEPELVSVIDLADGSKNGSESSTAFATFQPPGGCSFLSFAPNGLSLLTANRKGEVQYVWDLVQIRYPRMALSLSEDETGNFPIRVRQIAKFERFSPSMSIDVQWDGPMGYRFATLTQNRTVHIFDLPASAMRWPPASKAKKPRPVSAPAQNPEPAQAPPAPTGFFASAMNFASSAQPMLANLRGRAPSVSGGVSGIGASGMGIASATGMRSGKVVAAGFSKSLGAASDTVAHIRHAGQSKLHLRGEAMPSRMIWRKQGGRTVLCILDTSAIRTYYVRKTNPRERQQETVTVFDARKAVSQKIPENLVPRMEQLRIDDQPIENEIQQPGGFWKPPIPSDQKSGASTTAPLSFAEIETNHPYLPFHSDHKVSMSVYTDEPHLSEDQISNVSVIFQPRSQQKQASSSAQWVFGGSICTTEPHLKSQAESISSQPAQVLSRGLTEEAGHEIPRRVVRKSKKPKAKGHTPASGDATHEEEQEEVFAAEPDMLD
jgi:hypothetical protein